MTEPVVIEALGPIELPTPMERPIRLLRIGGKDVSFRGLTEGQYMQMVHEASIFSNENTPNDRRMKSLDRLFRVMFSLVVEPEDREYVEDQMADGEIDIHVLLKALRDVYKVDDTAQPKVRRGRPAKRQ